MDIANPSTGSGLPSQITDALKHAAQQAAEHAYAPYSKFRVGAALLLADGKIITGCNVENGSFGLTICAERSAVVRAVSELGPKIRIKAVAVANLNGAASPPCGACRQVLSEFVAADALVLFPGIAGWESVPFREIFPFSFELTRGD
ncbi:MAG TPA: cytidine deaminase [Acidisarcina sp.]